MFVRWFSVWVTRACIPSFNTKQSWNTCLLLVVNCWEPPKMCGYLSLVWAICGGFSGTSCIPNYNTYLRCVFACSATRRSLAWYFGSFVLLVNERSWKDWFVALSMASSLSNRFQRCLPSDYACILSVSSWSDWANNRDSARVFRAVSDLPPGFHQERDTAPGRCSVPSPGPADAMADLERCWSFQPN